MRPPTGRQPGGVSLTEGPVEDHLIRLTVPMIFGMASMMLAGFIDLFYVGHFGTHPLSALALTMPVVMVMMSLSMGVGIGATSVIARALGSGDRARVRRLATHSLLLVLLISVVSAIAGIVYARPIFSALGAKDITLDLVVSYMRVWFFGLPLFAVTMVGTSVMRAVGSARAPGVIMTMSSVLQVLLAPLLMFGIPNHLPGIGFEGSALGFVTSRFIGFCFALYLIGRRLKLLTRQGLDGESILSSWGEVMRISVPSSLSQLIGPVSMAFVLALLTPYGAAVVASMGVAQRLEGLSTLVLMSLSGSLSPFIGQNFGAHEDDRIRESLRISYRFSLVYAVGIAIFLAVTGQWITAVINADPAVVHATYVYLLIVPLSYSMLGVGMCASSLFMALGKPLPTLLMSIGRMFVLYVPMAWAFNKFFGYAGVFAATALANVAMGVVAMTWAKRQLAREIQGRARV